MKNPTMSHPLLITAGEPAGIGAEVSLAALDYLAQRDAALSRYCVLADCDWLREVAKSCGFTAPLYRVESLEEFGTARQPGLAVWHHPLHAPVVAGQLNPANAHYVLALLDSAIAACLRGHAPALITAPIQKSVLMGLQPGFQGHTEYLAAHCLTSPTAGVVMLLTAPLAEGELRVAMATTHLPLKAVPAAITATSLGNTLDVLDRGLRQQFNLKNPAIVVCGLNPHAGESGQMGDEETLVIAPAVAAARARGINAIGPVPADTAFLRYGPGSGDSSAFLAMYHDQGLAVFKWAAGMSGAGAGVNCTLGLPFIRTSPDHGTALDIAGQGRADPAGMIAALQLAGHLAERQGR